MAFAIFRLAKLSSIAAVAGSSSHMARTRETPNADASLTDQNEILIGTANPRADVLDYLQAAEEAYEQNPGQDARGRRIPFARKNGVKAAEVFAGASPEWPGWEDPELEARWVAGVRQHLEATFGADNIRHLQIHRDESTPHITGLVTLIDPRTGRPNQKAFWDGPRELSQMQTDHHAALGDIGLERGTQRVSDSMSHEAVKAWYRRMTLEHAAKRDQVQVAVAPGTRLGNPTTHAEHETARINTDLAEQLDDLHEQAAYGRVARKREQELQAERDQEHQNRLAAEVAADQAAKQVASLQGGLLATDREHERLKKRNQALAMRLESLTQPATAIDVVQIAHAAETGEVARTTGQLSAWSGLNFPADRPQRAVERETGASMPWRKVINRMASRGLPEAVRLSVAQQLQWLGEAVAIALRTVLGEAAQQAITAAYQRLSRAFVETMATKSPSVQQSVEQIEQLRAREQERQANERRRYNGPSM